MIIVQCVRETNSMCRSNQNGIKRTKLFDKLNSLMSIRNCNREKKIVINSN